MSLRTHQRAIGAPPCYELPPLATRKRSASGFHRAFRHARVAPAPHNVIASACTRRPERDTVWPTALAIMLVANFAASATAAIPRRFHEPAQGAWDAPQRSNIDAYAFVPQQRATPVRASPPADVVIERVRHAPIKSDYTPVEVLRAVAAARAPFSNTAESLADAYTLVTGHEVAPQTRKTVQGWTTATDLATSLIPKVQVLRLPAEISDITADTIEGKALSVERLAGMIQIAAPRGNAMHTAHAIRHTKRRGVRKPDRLLTAKLPEPPDDERMGIVKAPDNLSVREKTVGRYAIQGEFDHLDGYAQTFSKDALPAEKAKRLVLVGGHHYLRGEAGYYRATKGLSDDHWLIDAPRRNRAQVPVTYDVATRRWEAHEPLRMCGGGCGSSRPKSPDSIAGSFDDIASAIRHLDNEVAQEAIPNAFADVSRLHLVRSNRADLRAMRDYSIIDHRAALRTAMRDIDRRLPLVKQQRLAAGETARYYYSHPSAEAFCQENAEILFHFLLQDGIGIDQLRMITVHPLNRSPHVLVFYTDSHRFMSILDASTPQPPVSLHRDGISSTQFAWAAYLTRDSTLLLDPWSRSKAISFARCDSPRDVVDVLDAAFADIGHSPGKPYTVSVTRPLTNPRGATSSQSSLGSAGDMRSSGESFATSRQSSASSSGTSPLLSSHRRRP